MKEIIDGNGWDLAASGTEAAKQRKEAFKKQGKAKAKKQDNDLEELDLEALQQDASDSATTLAAIQESIAKATERMPMDSIGNFGTYLISEMRAMSKGRYKVFKREVQALLFKYQSSTSDEDQDEERPAPTPKKSNGGGMQSGQQSSSGACGGYVEWQPHPFNWMPIFNPPPCSPWQSAGRGNMQQYYNRMPQYRHQQQYQGSAQQHCVQHPQQSQPRSQSQPSSSNKGPDPSTSTTKAIVSSGINLDPSQLIDDSSLESVNL